MPFLTRNRTLPALLLATELALAIPCCRSAESPAPKDRPRPIVSVRTDERLFTVLCAAQAGGATRRERIKDLDKLDPSVTEEVRNYIRSRGFSEGDFCEYSLLLSAPPEFTKKYATIDPIPPVRIPIGDFHKVLGRFYREADIHSLWLDYLPKYERQAERYRGKASGYIAEVLDFLREPLPENEGSIVLIPNLLQKKGSGYGVLLDGVSYMIVGPSTSKETIQHEFLHTIVNPLTREHIALIYRAKALHPLARTRTPFYYRSWETIVNETLIRTIVAMLENEGPGKREKAVRKLIDQGYLLASHFLDKLMEYENGSLCFREFYPNLFREKELARETSRLLERWKPPFSRPGKLKGPLNEAVSRRYKAIRVYGTRGSEQETREILKAIEFNEAAYFNRIDPVKADTEVTEEDIRTSNLFLYGTVESNALIQAIAPELPVSISSRTIEVGDRKYTDPRTKLVMACPNPLDPGRYVVLYTGLSWQTVMDAHTIFHGPTDYVICRGLERLEEGFFDKGDSRRWKPPEKYRTFPSDENWKVHRSEHYIFHFRPNSIAEEEIGYIAAVQEAGYQRILGILGETTGPTIGYYLYESLADKARITGVKGSGIAEAALGEVHVVYGNDRKVTGLHEDCHVLAQQLWGGSRLPFLVEGLAVYCDGHWLSAPVDRWVSVLSKRGDLIPLQGLLQPDLFESYPDLLTYPVAGSFVKFLIEKFGIEDFRTFYLSARPASIREDFEKIYPLSLEEAERGWLSACRAFEERFPFLGFVAAEVQGEVVVTRVYDGSPSHRAGLEVGDVLRAIALVAAEKLDDSRKSEGEPEKSLGASKTISHEQLGRMDNSRTTGRKQTERVPDSSESVLRQLEKPTDLREALAGIEPEEELILVVSRKGKSVELRIEAATLESYLEGL